MKTKHNQQRNENSQYFAGLKLKAACMRAKVPKHYYLPAINIMITAGEYTNAVKKIRSNDLNQEYKQSFEAWFPRKGCDIIRYEVLPAIHERINLRALQ